MRHPKDCEKLLSGRVGSKAKPVYELIAKRASDVMTQTRLRPTNWNGG